MESFEIDGNRVKDFAEFITEMNTEFIDRIEGNLGWNGNLDALNDYLCWPESKYKFTFRNTDSLREALSYPETIRWLTDNLAHCHPENRTSIRAKIARAEQKQGETLFDIILEIFQSNAELVEFEIR